MHDRAVARIIFLGTLWIASVAVAAAQADLDAWSIDRFQQAVEAQKARQYEKAAEQYRQVLSKNPNFAEAYLNLGIVQQLQYHYSESITILRKGLAIKPDMLAADVLLGISYYMLQDFQAARKPLEEVLAHNPKERAAGIYRALALLGLDQTEEAARQLRRTGEYFPNDIEISYHLGVAYGNGVKKCALQLLETSRESSLYEWATAISADRKNDTAAALLHYMKAIRIDPNIPQIYSRIAVLFEGAGFPDLAGEARRRLSIEDSQPPSRAVGGEPAASISKTETTDKRDYLVLWAQLGQTRPDPGLPRIADTYIDKLVREQVAADATGALRAAVVSYEKGDYPAAAASLGASMQTPGRHWIFPYLLARCYVEEGEFDSAEKVLETSLARQSNLPSVVFLTLEVRSELALRCYDFVLSKQPDSNAARILRAKSFAAANNPDKAVEEYRAVLQVQPDLPEVHLGIAQIYADELNWQGVIEELRKELELSPENGLALALLGHAYAESDQPGEAVPILTKVLTRFPRDAGTLADLGKSFAQKGNTEKAIQFYESAVLYDPSRYQIHYRLFQLYQSTSHAEAARQHLSAFRAEDAKHRANDVVIR
jgi:tetratricopeptide (TPR) repeat protein